MAVGLVKKMAEETKMKISAANSGSNNGMHGKRGELAPGFGRVGEKYPSFGKTGELSYSFGKKNTHQSLVRLYPIGVW